MTPPGADTVLVRYGDLGSKSPRVRGKMEQRLVENVAAVLDDRGLEGEVERRHARPVIHTVEDAVESVARATADAFGVVSTSATRAVDPTLPAIGAALVETARAGYDGGSFAIDARRSTADLPYDSDDVEREGGAAVFEALEDAGYVPTVDLDDPDHVFSAECRREEAFVYADRVEGPGGLPLGTQAPLVALVSGGIDSPVAAHEAMRRGSPVYPLYVDLGGYGGPGHEARAVEAIRHLGRYAPNFDTRPRVARAGEAVEALATGMDRGRMLSLRRFMLRIAEGFARQEDATGIVTGEAIGQKSSQTARNLQATDAAVEYPVHRPLLTVDKNEITQRAREIGTFRGATIPAGCPDFAPSNPETNARLDRLREAEPDDLLDRADRIAGEIEVLDVE